MCVHAGGNGCEYALKARETRKGRPRDLYACRYCDRLQGSGNITLSARIEQLKAIGAKIVMIEV